MTSAQRKLCQDLVITPPSGLRRISKEEFLRQFPSSVEHGALALSLLVDADTTRSAEDLDCALIVGHVFGFTNGHVQILCRLVAADWHSSHEDVVEALDTIRDPRAVPALVRATEWIPGYLDYDENRALAIKAIWALGKIPGAEAERGLAQIAQSSDAELLRGAARDQIARRGPGRGN